MEALMSKKRKHGILDIKSTLVTDNFRQIPVYGIAGLDCCPGCATIITGWKFQRETILSYWCSNEKVHEWSDIPLMDGHGSPIRVYNNQIASIR